MMLHGMYHISASDTTEADGGDDVSSTEMPRPVVIRTDPTVDDTNCTELNTCRICPMNVDCYKLGGHCIQCDFKANCTYGQQTTVTCRAREDVECNVGIYLLW